MSKYATVRKPYDPRWLHGAGACQPDILHRLDGEHFDFWHPTLPKVQSVGAVGVFTMTTGSVTPSWPFGTWRKVADFGLEVIEADNESFYREKLPFWHPALPEVRHAQDAAAGWAGIWIVTGEAKRTGGYVWRGAMAVLVLSLLFPVASWGAEPCKVNVASCTAAECAYLPGIGPSKGAAIEAAHPKTEAELDAVPGIGAATLAKIRPHVVYSGPTTCTSKQAAPTMPEGGTDGPKDGAR